MKFFTPDLYRRMQRSETQEMDAADAEWENAIEQYERRLATIRDELPESALKLLDAPRLHDAEVLWMGQAGPFFGVLVNLDSPSHGTVLLTYRTIEGIVRFNTGLLPDGLCSSSMQWMYEEIDLGGRKGCFRHSVLFSNGSELEVEAEDVQLATVDTFYAPTLPSKVPA